MLKAYLVYEDTTERPNPEKDTAYVFAEGKVEAKHIYKRERNYSGKLQAVRAEGIDYMIKDDKHKLVPYST